MVFFICCSKANPAFGLGSEGVAGVLTTGGSGKPSSLAVSTSGSRDLA